MKSCVFFEEIFTDKVTLIDMIIFRLGTYIINFNAINEVHIK